MSKGNSSAQSQPIAGSVPLPAREAEPSAAIAFLEDAARYFERRPTGGEDGAHWSNTYNAENCRGAARLIASLSSENE